MTFTPKPMQTLILWALIARGGTALQKEIKPEVKKPLRDELANAGLLDVNKSGRAFVLEVTDKGWGWAGDNLDAELPTRSTAAGPIMQAFLGRIKRYLDANGVALAEVITPLDEELLADAALTAAGANAAPSTAGDLRAQIRSAYLELSQGRLKERVRIHRLRDALAKVDRNLFEQTLREMQREEDLVLMPLDNPREITEADRAAALDIAGNPRHIVYLGAH